MTLRAFCYTLAVILCTCVPLSLVPVVALASDSIDSTNAGASSDEGGSSAAATSATEEKVATPAVVEYVIWEDSTDSWGPVADHAQGDDIPYRLTASMAQDLTAKEAYPYWIVIRPEDGLTYMEGSARVACLHTDGTSDDVTLSLQVGLDTDGRIVAGAQDIKTAIPGVSATDKLVLTYTMRFNERRHLGLARGNESYGHVEYGQGAESEARPAGGSQAASRIPIWAASAVPVIRALAAGPSEATEERGEEVTVRGTDLTSSPELKVTAHTYVVRMRKLAQGTATPLAGASFSLRDADGRWFVQGEPWDADQAKATVRTTDSQGYAEFVGVDAEQYELVEVQAPRGYLAVGPVDISLESDFGVWSLKAGTHADVSLEADAQGGTVTVQISDPAQAGTTKTAIARTGDTTPAAALPAIFGIAGLAALCVAKISFGKETRSRKSLLGPGRKEEQ